MDMHALLPRCRLSTALAFLYACPQHDDESRTNTGSRRHRQVKVAVLPEVLYQRPYYVLLLIRGTRPHPKIFQNEAGHLIRDLTRGGCGTCCSHSLCYLVPHRGGVYFSRPRLGGSTKKEGARIVYVMETEEEWVLDGASDNSGPGSRLLRILGELITRCRCTYSDLFAVEFFVLINVQTAYHSIHRVVDGEKISYELPPFGPSRVLCNNLVI